MDQSCGCVVAGMSSRTRKANENNPVIGFSSDEEDLIVRLHSLLGNRWSLIAGRVPGRTDEQIKTYWHSTLSKKSALKRLIRPRTHKLCMKRSASEAISLHGPLPKLRRANQQPFLLESVDDLKSVLPQDDVDKFGVAGKSTRGEYSSVETRWISKECRLLICHRTKAQYKIEDSCSGTWGRY